MCWGWRKFIWFYCCSLALSFVLLLIHERNFCSWADGVPLFYFTLGGGTFSCTLGSGSLLVISTLSCGVIGWLVSIGVGIGTVVFTLGCGMFC